MSNLPKVAIVGRPNVGKSALFNRICNKKIAIVDEMEGVTRDRLYANCDFFGIPFEVIDTGGINSRSKALFNEEVMRQAEIAIEEADSIILVVDAQVGVTDLDQDMAKILHQTQKPVCLAVNKVDDQSKEHHMYDFSCLGFKHIVAVSAAQSWHIAELLEVALADYTRPEEAVSNPDAINLCIVGRPNVGKSSLVNYLLNEERCIVSPIPGTTRDSIDVPFTHEGKLFTLIDTAGIRRKGAEHEVVDKFAAMRTQRAIDRSDICLLMLDAQQGITTQEKRIANMIEEAGKGCIILFNKWDLVKGFRMEHCLKSIQDEVPFLLHCPKLFISAKTGRNVEKIFELVNQVAEESKKRITTHQLNKFVGLALQKNHPPMVMGKRLRIYYMAQVSVQPPKFILFVNNVRLMTESYRKYLYNQFREVYGFLGVPIGIHLKGKLKTQEEKQGGPKAVPISEYPHLEKNCPTHAQEEAEEADVDFDKENFDEEDFDVNELLEEDGIMEEWRE